ncbi:MAG: hypothetical protein GXP04_05320 [Alphaproteobacteria bacterium]|nr:hypothetical protein [Alphaproteobacteria bacterium]
MQTRSPITIIFITFFVACAAWSVTIGIHELGGHGGHCAWDLNCQWQYADAMYFGANYNNNIVDIWQIAAGVLAVITLSTIALLILWLMPPKGFALYVFLWSIMAIGLIQSGAYIAFGWLIHPGMDWARLVVLAGDDIVAKGLAVSGGLLFVIAGVLACRKLMPRINTKTSTLTGLPIVIAAYLGFAATALAASWFVPADNRLFMLYGGLGSGAIFMFWFLFSALPKSGPTPLLEIRKVTPTIITTSIITFAYVFILGRGIDF